MAEPTQAPTVAAVRPSAEYGESFLQAIDGYEAVGETVYSEMYTPARDDFDGFVRGLLEQEQGINLKEGWVPCSHRWLVTPGRDVVGVVRIRHTLAPMIALGGGHIGYDVPPAWRRRGFGKLCLLHGLARAKEVGLERVLVTCSPNNTASKRVIEGGGGLFESEVQTVKDGPKLRYWIAIR